MIGDVDALIYIMHEERSLGCPTYHYYNVCLEGYSRFGFEHRILEKALTDSVGVKFGKRMLKEVIYRD